MGNISVKQSLPNVTLNRLGVVFAPNMFSSFVLSPPPPIPSPLPPMVSVGRTKNKKRVLIMIRLNEKAHTSLTNIINMLQVAMQ